MNAYLLTFTAAAVLSLFLTRLCRDLALRFSWLDVPDATRKLHAAPVPAIGGVALALSTVLGLVIASLLSASSGARLDADLSRILPLGALCTMMMLVGLVDDLRTLRPTAKIALQVAVAVAAWIAGIRIESLGTYRGGGLNLQMLSLPLTVLWMVGITNAFNLLDGIDGLAAGAALFATTALMGVAIASQEFTTALILAAVAGATAAFLRYNFNPASIFLGDSGSLFLGFTLSVLSVQSSQKSAAAFAVAVPIVSLGLPVLDTSVVVLRRLISDKPLFAADRRHIHHILLDRGMSVRQVAVWMYALCGALGCVSLLLASPSAEVVGPVLVILGVAVGIGVQQLHIPELRAFNSHVVRGFRSQRPMLAGATVVETMLGEIEHAADVDQLLQAIAHGLADSGLVAATLSAPGWLAIEPSPTGSWRFEQERPADPRTCSLQWRNQPAGTVTTLVLPLFDDGRPGTLTISAEAGDVHHTALINWLGREVAHAIGMHLARVAGASMIQAESATLGRVG